MEIASIEVDQLYKVDNIRAQIKNYLFLASELKNPFYVTLLVNGLVVTGTLVSEGQFRRETVMAQCELPVPPAIAGQPRIRAVKPPGDDNLREEMVYLREALVFVGGGRPKKLSWLQISVASIDAFSAEAIPVRLTKSS